MEQTIEQQQLPVAPEKNSSFLVTLLSVLLLISVFIAGFFAYQTQNLVKELNKLKITPTSIATPSPSPDPTANWKTYTNTKYNFSLRYPNNYELLNESIDKISFGFKSTNQDLLAPPYLNIYFNYKSKAADSAVDIKVDNVDAKMFDIHKGADSDYRIVQISNPAIEIEMNISGGGLSRDLDQILSTFKFIENCKPRPACLDSEPRCLIPEIEDMCPPASSAPTQRACTMEARICPDGSAVGRSGPNCDFAPCPTSRP